MFVHLATSALRQTARFGMHSALAMLGVAIGVANIILLINITDLGRRQAIGLFNEFGANLLIVTPYFDIEGGALSTTNLSQLSAHLPDQARHAVAQAPEIEAVAAAMLEPAHVGRGDAHVFATLMGVTPPFATLIGHGVTTGRWLTEQDLEKKAHVVCLGNTVRQALFADEDPLGKEILIKNESFAVVGLMELKGRIGLEDVDNRVFVPLPVAQELYGFDGVHGMFARYKPGVAESTAIDAVWRQLQPLLKPGEKLHESFSVFTVKEARRVMESTLAVFRTVLAGIASIALLVAGLGIMNVMLIRVLQRRLEIGVRRAVGATTAAVVLQFLVESAVQALLGSVAGVVIGTLGVFAYCKYAQWAFYVGPATVVAAVFFGVAAGLLFGAYPAFNAARLDPIEALRRA